jgi:hypothetical protein
MNIKSWAGILAALISLATVVSGQTTTSQEVLTLDKIVVTEMKGFSDQAIPEVTPVSFSEIGKETIAAELGSRDIPLVLNSTPSVFSTTAVVRAMPGSTSAASVSAMCRSSSMVCRPTISRTAGCTGRTGMVSAM